MRDAWALQSSLHAMPSSRALDVSKPESTMRDLVESGRHARENAIKKHEHALELLTKVSCRGSLPSRLKQLPV